MKHLTRRVLRLLLLMVAAAPVGQRSAVAADQAAADFPPELVNFVPYKVAPLLAGAGKDTWDRSIRFPRSGATR